MNGKVVKPHYYADNFGLIASVIDGRITLIGYIGGGNYIGLQFAATTADGKTTTIYANSAQVTNDVFGSGPRKLGQPGTIDHSKSGGRRQHNVPEDLKTMFANHNSAGGNTWERKCGYDIVAQVSQGKNLILIQRKFVTLFSKAILDNESANPPMSTSCFLCFENFDVDISVKCSKCDRIFCRACHRPNIHADVPVEPQGWACSYCIVVNRTNATMKEIGAAIEHTEAMDEIQGGEHDNGGGQAPNAGDNCSIS